jgi:hypothetical protein
MTADDQKKLKKSQAKLEELKKGMVVQFVINRAKVNQKLVEQLRAKGKPSNVQPPK